MVLLLPVLVDCVLLANRGLEFADEDFIGDVEDDCEPRFELLLPPLLRPLSELPEMV